MTDISELKATLSASASPLFAPDIAIPPQDWRDANYWKFDSFALHLNEQQCTSCDAVHRWSEAFRMFTRTYPAATDRRYVMASYIPPALRVVTFKTPVRIVPLCHNCLKADRPGQAVILVSTEGEWAEAQRRTRELLAQQKKKPASPALVPLKDLL